MCGYSVRLLCASENRETLQRIIRTAQQIIGTQLPLLEEINHTLCIHRAGKIIKDLYHPGNKLFSLLPSSRCYRSLYAHTTQLRNCFYSTAIPLLNSHRFNIPPTTRLVWTVHQHSLICLARFLNRSNIFPFVHDFISLLLLFKSYFVTFILSMCTSIVSL